MGCLWHPRGLTGEPLALGKCVQLRWAKGPRVTLSFTAGLPGYPGLRRYGPEAPGNTGLRKFNPVLTLPHNKKGWLNLNHPLMDVASKMPFLFFFAVPRLNC